MSNTFLTEYACLLVDLRSTWWLILVTVGTQGHHKASAFACSVIWKSMQVTGFNHWVSTVNLCCQSNRQSKVGLGFQCYFSVLLRREKAMHAMWCVFADPGPDLVFLLETQWGRRRLCQNFCRPTAGRNLLRHMQVKACACAIGIVQAH